MKFKYSSIVEDSEEEKMNVGSEMTMKYKDKTTQKVRVLGINDLDHSITWEMTESEPAVKFTSVVNTITLRRITTQLDGQKGKTFVEWVSDYSNDATAEVIQDSDFKKKESFKALGKCFSE